MYFAQELGKGPGRKNIQVERMFELRDRAGKQQAPVGGWSIGVVEHGVVRPGEADDEAVKKAFFLFSQKGERKESLFFHVK